MSNPHPPVTLPGTEVRLLESSQLNQTYKLFVALPQGYEATAERYPVLYLTDANWLFGLVPTLAWLRLPPMIVVGIGYPTDDFVDIRRLRARDLTPTQNQHDERAVQEEHQMPIESGGGEAFLSFISDDLFPFVDAEYRSDPTDRALFGYSFGGTFGLYTLFSRPNIFKRYILGAPDLRWDNEICLQYEAAYAAKQKDLDVRLYLAVGTLDEDLVERNASNLFRFQAMLKSREYDGLALTFELLDDESHSTAVGLTLSRGLRAVFG